MVNMITALCGYFSGTFVSDTGGTFKSDTPGTFVSDIGGTFEVILSKYSAIRYLIVSLEVISSSTIIVFIMIKMILRGFLLSPKSRIQ